ncbi:unnamed protein product [Rhizoctonia solani]|uniref:CFEM domain-containing protein n=1 Tax=Rhizoctonia solani TaxID=456999 RepID=A0A8H3BA26_9AGAM|nr:unnamed protein product [Rhizoctonia solani]
MRLCIVFAMALVMGVLGQSSSNEPDVSVVTNSPAPEPTTPPPSLITITEAPITSPPSETSTISTEPTTTITTLSTAAPPSGGGATCVQQCLAQSAATVGCRSGADVACVCNSQTYLSLARTCFTNSGCDDISSQQAVQDYGTACSATTTPAETSMSTRSTSHTRTNSGSLTSLTTRTIVFTSGAVVSISRGVSSTITSGFTTVRTGQAGDFATDGGSVPTSGTDGGSANNAALGLGTGHLASAGMMMGLGVIGGIAVLVL